MKIIFAVVLLLHSLIHLMGVARAFWPGSIPQLSRNITRTEGVFWLLSFSVLFAAFIFYFFRKEWWPATAIFGVILSQFLISLNWQDARFATLINLLILAMALSAVGKNRFDNRVLKETSSILSSAGSSYSLQNPEALPPIVQKWLKVSGSLDHPIPKTVRLEQQGEMRITKKGKWMPFSAVQYFNAEAPAFVWKTRVKAFPLVDLSGRDKLQNGKGEMLIQLFSLFTVAHAAGDQKVDSGTLQRFLGEICWFPSAALRPYLSWEQINDNSAKAVFNQEGLEVEGIFHFSAEGRLQSFEAMRYFGTGKDAKKEKWVIEVLKNDVFQGISVPSQCKVTWQLPEGDFHWLSLKITSLEFDPKPYPLLTFSG